MKSNDEDTLKNQTVLIQALALKLEKELHPVQIFETHISWVLVAGKLAYKFKKAVRFDFLDFSTLSARHFYCQEELRLNRRLAPDMYLDVVPISGSIADPALDQAGVPFEYAVKMRAFEQQELWSYRIKNGLISPLEIDSLAQAIAAFHGNVETASEERSWGAPEVIYTTADENFTQIAALVNTPPEESKVRELRRWEMLQRAKLNDEFKRRKAQGFIRACHGDLHGGNILTINGQVKAFDCIEFNERMRWIDVMNDIAFTCMDLQFQGRQDLSARFLNRYLEITGDYEGLAVLRYYQVHRALVRCKVALLLKEELPAASRDADALEQQGKRYLDFAADYSQPASSAIMITHGYSGSGKSTFAAHLLEFLSAIRLRSDVERKRMHGLDAISRVGNALGEGLYDSASTYKTYERLGEITRHLVEWGYPVIVDAAFLRHVQRQLFAALAAELRVPFIILDVHASETTMRARLASRAKLNQDASDAGVEVLSHQIAHHTPLSEDEMVHAIGINLDDELDAPAVEVFCALISSRLQG